MRAEMLQYIHEGHQGKERCLLWARNTVFWPKITYDIQELIERCIICQEHGKSQSIIGTTQELPPFPWHTLATDIFHWKRMDLLIVADVFSKYFLVRKFINSTSAAVCAEIATIVTELGLPHIIRSDNGPCYNSKEFQQLLQHYNITCTHKEIQLWNALYLPGKETPYRIPIQIKQTGVYHQVSMLKIRCTPTEVKQTGHRNNQSSESEKAKFHTPAIPNATRNCVEHNSTENISQDLVHPTKSDIDASTSFDFKSEEREEFAKIADVPAFTPAYTPAPALERVKEQSHTPGSRKSTRKNFGKPASSFSDFYM